MENDYTFNIRVTGILIDKNKILLVKQKVTSDRQWSLPGGRVEVCESLEDAMAREMLEETGLSVSCKKLLYLCEKLDVSPPILHITFLLEEVGGTLTLPSNEYDKNPISDVNFVSIEALESYGFSKRFIEIITSDFPDAGTYQGDKSNIGL